MLWGAGLEQDLRVIGADDRVAAAPLNNDLSIAGPNDVGSVIMTPGGLHGDLRRVAGLDGQLSAYIISDPNSRFGDKPLHTRFVARVKSLGRPCLTVI